MEMQGKKVVFLGDSITEGALASRPENVFHQVAARLLGLGAAYNCGIGGTRIARQRGVSADTRCDLDLTLRAERLPQDAEFAVVFGGTNDFGHGDAPFGEAGDHTVDTFCGACNCLLDKLCAQFGAENVLAMPPLHRVGEENPFGDGCKKQAGKPLRAYAEAFLAAAKAHGVHTLWLWESAFDPNCSEGAARFAADGLHPNDEGHRLLGERVAAYLRGL